MLAICVTLIIGLSHKQSEPEQPETTPTRKSHLGVILAWSIVLTFVELFAYMSLFYQSWSSDERFIYWFGGGLVINWWAMVLSMIARLQNLARVFRFALIFVFVQPYVTKFLVAPLIDIPHLQ